MAFWQRLARERPGRVLELGCGTGRVTLPVARTGARLVGIDRSARMLARARARVRRSNLASRVGLLRGDIRALPFRDGEFDLVMAPYGILQSLVREADLVSTLRSVARVLCRGGSFGLDLVPDLPAWAEYRRRLRLRGTRRGGRAHVALLESVHQDRERNLTVFDQEYLERRGDHRTRHAFTLTFRTLSVRQMRRRLERAGFHVDAVLGDYAGGPWDRRADVWVLLATKQ